MDEPTQPTRRASPMRLLAAALAGGLGAFGIAGGAHVPAAPAAVAAPSVAVTPDSTPD